MIRAVLVGFANDDWRIFRQPQWMAEVRRAPEITRWPRFHYDISEEAYSVIIDAWDVEGAGSGHEAADHLIRRLGGIEILRP